MKRVTPVASEGLRFISCHTTSPPTPSPPTELNSPTWNAAPDLWRCVFTDSPIRRTRGATCYQRWLMPVFAPLHLLLADTRRPHLQQTACTKPGPYRRTPMRFTKHWAETRAPSSLATIGVHLASTEPRRPPPRTPAPARARAAGRPRRASRRSPRRPCSRSRCGAAARCRATGRTRASSAPPATARGWSCRAAWRTGG